MMLSVVQTAVLKELIRIWRKAVLTEVYIYLLCLTHTGMTKIKKQFDYNFRYFSGICLSETRGTTKDLRIASL